MKKQLLESLAVQLGELKSNGLYKEERLITSPQQANITIKGGKKVINLCANNYLGLANDPHLTAAAKAGLEKYGFGMASVRFICGTQTIHQELEKKLSQFLGTEETILYTSCWDANGGLFETIFGTEDALISDSLNHASIIDGIRLCKARRLRYLNNDMADLKEQLKATMDARYRMIVTDGVFSMDGTIANLSAICDLADRYDAFVMVDDSHAVGFLGTHGKGSPEYCDVMGRVDVITGTLGKALGGASGGYTSGRKEIIDWLRQRSRPYLFSNTVAPSIVTASIAALDLITSESGNKMREKLQENSRYFRKKMNGLGFTLIPGSHPIIPIMLEDAKLAQEFAKRALEHGVYVIGFSYPVVPQGKARIRTQMSVAHSKEDLDHAINAFEIVGKELKII